MTVFVAQAVAAVMTLGEIALFLVLIPAILRVYDQHRLTPSGLTGTIDWLNWYGVLLAVLVLNGAIFWMCERLGRRYWLGIAFIPSMIYAFITFAVLLAMIIPTL